MVEVCLISEYSASATHFSDNLQRGLLSEISELQATAGPSPDYSSGIYQAIGFKEFAAFLSRDPALEKKDGLMESGLESMKISTRQYAKRQVKWIKTKLLPALEAQKNQDVILYLLDATGWFCCFFSAVPGRFLNR